MINSIQKFREKGIKITPQRVAILTYLDGNTGHPSAEDIYNEVKKIFPMMSFATVYKTLERLKQRGDILELTIDPERRRYDPDTRAHHHLICSGCKKIVDIHTEIDITLPDDVKENFELTGNHIEFYGMCSECDTVRKNMLTG